MKFKRFLSILMVLCMALTFLPPQVEAETVQEPQNAVSEGVFITQDEAIQTIRECLVNRLETFTVAYTADTFDEDCGTALLEAALAHTGVPDEGDYLHWHLSGYEVEIAYAAEDMCYMYITYNVSYYTDAEQEATVTAQVAALLNELNPSGSDYEKIKTVYDWICANVSYDHANLEDDAYTLKYSAYAALINRTAVCQGYALLLYRLALEMGIDCRIITGTSQGENHAWNIVKLGDLYYNLDATWDAELSSKPYFLKCESNFEDHTRAEEYTTEFFHAAYPMASEDYTPDDTDGDFLASGTCPCGQVWTLTHDGVLTVSGTGDAEAAWEEYRDEIRKIVVNEGITGLAGFFSGYTKLSEVELPGTLEDLGFAQFSECLALETVRLSEGTKSIGMFCFDGCVSLKNINFPSTLETIGDDAFRNSGLESVVTSCSEIGNFAFTGCYALREVILEDGVVSIGEGAFAYNTAMETVSLPSTLTSIGGSAFYECTNLSSPITIPEGVTALQSSTFFKCEKLEEICLPSTLQSIGGGAFQYTGIALLRIPGSVEYIGDAAFYGCSNLRSLELCNGVKHIGAAFFLCGITSLHLPASVETIDTTLWYTSMMAEVTVDADNLYFTAVDGILYNKDMTEIIFCPPQWTGELVIPDTVQTLAGGVFAGCGNITTIVIPDSVTAFGTNIFECCGVHTVVLPDGMEAIPDNMFNQCGSLVSVKLPDSITSIGGGAFRGCLSLETLHIPAGVSAIGGEAFAGCHALQLSVDTDSSHYQMLDGVLYTKDMKQLVFATRYAPTDFTVPEGVETLRNYSFSSHEELERIVFADSVKQIGEYAFAYLQNLNSVAFGTGLKSIGNSAFYYCQNLKDVVFADATFSIGVRAFGDCVSLTSIVIPGTVTKMDNVAFWRCAALANIQIGSITEKVGGDVLSETAYYNDPNNWENGCLYLSDWLITGEQLASDIFAIPDGTYGIADSGLSGRSALVEVTVPGSVKIIGDSAFAGCGALEIVNLSNGLERIGDLAFGNCRKLGTLTIPATVTYIGWQFWVGLRDFNSNTLVFLGDAPEFHEQAFMNLMPTVVYYPETLDSWTAIAGSGFGAGEHSVEDADGNVTTYSSVAWQSYAAGQCPRHSWAVSRCLHDCGEGGEIEYTCLVCQETSTETVAPSEHHISETITAATCTEGGYITRDCTICEYVYVEYLMDALGHSYESVVTPPTYDSQGYTTYTCTLCGNSYVADYVDALTNYEVLEDSDSQWERHSGDSAAIHVDADITEFVEVRVNGEVLPSEYYTVTEGSTIVTLTSEYLTTLPAGLYSVEVQFTDGCATTTIEIIGSDILTGDVNNDGNINTVDAMLVLQYAVGILTADGMVLEASDVNQDGTTNTIDAMLILQYAVGLVTSLPVA